MWKAGGRALIISSLLIKRVCAPTNGCTQPLVNVLKLIAILSEDTETKGWSGQLPILKLNTFQVEGFGSLGAETATLMLAFVISIKDAKNLLLELSKTIFGSLIRLAVAF